MKKIILIISFLCFITIFFYNCTKKIVSTADNNTAPKEMGETNPNGSSELALLMREMDKDSWKIREAIEKNQNIPDIKDKFAKLHTATPTEIDKKDATYKVMGDAFLVSVDNLYKANSKEEKLSAYNIMVNNCLNCHKAACPGPIVKIKKLFVNQ
ncbi:MAG: hypothetical protein EAZ85_08925 [Bacteroidetes bacterium]|nr:MAG: hypothetical protein EAZ85_08925 [Bacteroidota bacterium]TAG88550.1 MAG: hypothetical protein EAZ20_08355 [Bacteroidota bacterium]